MPVSGQCYLNVESQACSHCLEWELRNSRLLSLVHPSQLDIDVRCITNSHDCLSGTNPAFQSSCHNPRARIFENADLGFTNCNSRLAMMPALKPKPTSPIIAVKANLYHLSPWFLTLETCL